MQSAENFYNFCEFNFCKSKIMLQVANFCLLSSFVTQIKKQKGTSIVAAIVSIFNDESMTIENFAVATTVNIKESLLMIRKILNIQRQSLLRYYLHYMVCITCVKNKIKLYYAHTQFLVLTIINDDKPIDNAFKCVDIEYFVIAISTYTINATRQVQLKK